MAGLLWVDDWADYYKAVAKDAGGSNIEMVLMTGAGTQQILARVYNGSTQVGEAASAVLGSGFLNSWHFILMWHDSINNIVGLEIDGTAVTAPTTGAAATSTATFTLGGDASAGYGLNGRMQRWGRWNRLLTADEKRILRNGGRGRNYPFITQ